MDAGRHQGGMQAAFPWQHSKKAAWQQPQEKKGVRRNFAVGEGTGTQVLQHRGGAGVPTLGCNNPPQQLKGAMGTLHAGPHNGVPRPSPVLGSCG